MVKVVRIFEYTLHADVQGEDFERFVTEELIKTPFVPGIQIRFLKCDRDSQGEVSRMYINELEFESVEIRDRYFPNGFEGSEEFNQWWSERGAVWNKFYFQITVSQRFQ